MASAAGLASTLSLEAHLSDEDFERILEMTRDEFSSLAPRAQVSLRRKAGLVVCAGRRS
jgi:hypothetical protein